MPDTASRKKSTGNLTSVSGFYLPVSPLPSQFSRAIHSIELRLDVDGQYPQNVFSITVKKKRGKDVTALLRVSPRAKKVFRGTVEKKWGGTFSFGEKLTVRITNTDSANGEPVIVLSGLRKENLRWKIPMKRINAAFREVALESDRVAGVRGVVSVDPAAHPVHHPSLSSGSLHVTDVFRTAGIDLRISGRHSVIPKSFSGADQAWNTRELHDAMQTYWSHFSKMPQWSMWVLFADRYAESFGVGGMMFDTKKGAQRRGMALFKDTMFYNPPAGVAKRALWKKRMKFFTFCHEIGHLFNLAHSREKASGNRWLSGGNNKPFADSFMNQPHFFEGGCEAFFNNFTCRFDDDELLFMRHAPEAFVQMGHGTWFKNHALALDSDQGDGKFYFNIRTKRRGNKFFYMEPVHIEMKLMNVSDEKKSVDFTEESMNEKVMFYVRDICKDTTVALRPFLNRDFMNEKKSMMPGDALYGSMFVSADTSGWIIAEPGSYTVQAAVDIYGKPVLSNQITLRVVRPKKYRYLEHIAQDYFSEDVGRVLAFNGSRVLDKANEVLNRCTEPDVPSWIALRARMALAIPLQNDSKTLSFRKNCSRSPIPEIVTVKGDAGFAEKSFKSVLYKTGPTMAATLSNFEYRKYADLYCNWLLDSGRVREALAVQKTLYNTLIERGVTRRSVLDAIAGRVATLTGGKPVS